MTSNPLVKIPPPQYRPLRVFTFDPSLNTSLDTAIINQMTLKVPWEKVSLGPVGEYLEVVDIDPASNAFYPPVDLENNYLLMQAGLSPSEGTPQFHQQMVYAVAMNTIENFELALGRKVLWSAREVNSENKFVRQLRIYPHALRQANAYYSPAKKALLFGYFPASTKESGRNLPGGIVFTCLSHDIITHETTHALMDGLHPYFGEPSNPDVLAMHEAFADIVALFQHFSHPEVLRHQISLTRGDLSRNNLLAQLAQQFGEATGKRGALRNAIGKKPDPTALQKTTEPHDRGSILVAAVFDAFLTVYKTRIADLNRIASGGSGVLPRGAIHPDLVNRLAQEASRVSQRILGMCIRALDYCPPVDITFGEYLRAIITADYDTSQLDDEGYRIAMIESFRQYGIYPSNVRSLSEESLLWFTPEDDGVLENFFNNDRLMMIHEYESKQRNSQNEEGQREAIFNAEQEFRDRLQNWIYGVPETTDLLVDRLERQGNSLKGNYESRYPDPKNRSEVVEKSMNIRLWPDENLRSICADNEGNPLIEVNSVRQAYRIDRRRQAHVDLVVEITQERRGYYDPQIQADVDSGKITGDAVPDSDFTFRGGATLLIDSQCGKIRYIVNKHVGSNRRLAIQRRYLSEPEISPALTYFGNPQRNFFKGRGEQREPFALLHGGSALVED